MLALESKDNEGIVRKGGNASGVVGWERGVLGWRAQPEHRQRGSNEESSLAGAISVSAAQVYISCTKSISAVYALGGLERPIPQNGSNGQLKETRGRA